MPYFVTNGHTNDGFGSQFQVIISLILVCFMEGYYFIYNPIKHVEHNYDDDPEFVEKIEHLMNIHSTFPIIHCKEQTEKLQIQMCDMTVKYVVDNDIEKYTPESSMRILRNMFWGNKNRHALFNGDTSHRHVAIHIRRPNPHDIRSFPNEQIPDDYYCRVGTPDEYYLNVIEMIREKHGGEQARPLLFHIYSQGEPQLFQKYIAEDTVLCINTDIFSSFMEMVAADILMTSFSSFSYVAAFLNEGIVYYHPFWHPPKKDWNVVPLT